MALVLTRLVRSNYDELDNIPIIHQDLTKSFTKQADTYYIHTGSTTPLYTKGRMYYCDGTNLKKVVIVDELPKVNDGKLTITVNGTAHTFTANQAGDTSFSITDNDTGATSVEVTGAGNAVTAASYNASTRKLTLTKGATFLTSHQDISGKLDKTTYEWNKEFAAGSNGAISLGRYNIYDTQLTFDISSTTNVSMSGKLVIATQNGKILQAKVFGDATGALVSKIVIYQSAIVNNRSWIEVFCNFDGWSKNKVHIYGVALESATVTNQMSSVTFINGVPSPITSGDSKWSGTIDNDLSGKQNKLTAGSNITISGNTISATDTNTATAADNILDGSNNGTQITYAPYTSQQLKLSFDTSITLPTRTDRLNLNGYLYATKLYSDGKEVLTRTTYEWNKEFSADSNGAISLGRYNVYNSQLTFDISSTTSTSINGKLVIATQNGQILQAKVFGDATGALVSKIIIYQSRITNHKSWIEVFCNFDGLSKNKVHIYGVALNSTTVTHQMSSVTITNGVPSPITNGDYKWDYTIVNDLSIKTLNTNNTTAQTATNEDIIGSGTINLHKVAKTGSYNDLLNAPTFSYNSSTKTLTIS